MSLNDSKKQGNESRGINDLRVWKQKQNLNSENIIGSVTKSLSQIKSYKDALNEEEKNDRKKKIKFHQSIDKFKDKNEKDNYVSENVKKIMGDVGRMVMGIRTAETNISKENIEALLKTTNEIKKSEVLGEPNTILKIKEKEYKLSLEGKLKKPPNYKFLSDCYRKQVNKAFVEYNPLIHLSNMHMLRQLDPEIEKEFQIHVKEIDEELKGITTSPNFCKDNKKKPLKKKGDFSNNENDTNNKDNINKDLLKKSTMKSNKNVSLNNLETTNSNNNVNMNILTMGATTGTVPTAAVTNALPLRKISSINNSRAKDSRTGVKNLKKASGEKDKSKSKSKSPPQKNAKDDNNSNSNKKIRESNISKTKQIGTYGKKGKHKKQEKEKKFPNKDSRESELLLMNNACEKLLTVLDENKKNTYCDNYKDIRNQDLPQQRHNYFGELENTEKILTEIQEVLYIKNLDEDIKNRKIKVNNDNEDLVDKIGNLKIALLNEIEEQDKKESKILLNNK